MIRKATRNYSPSVSAPFFAILTLLISAAALAQTTGAGQRPAQHAVVSGQQVENPQAQARILDGYGKLPLSFEANQGQSNARVKFLSRTGAYTLFLTGDEAVLTLRGKKAKKTSPQNLAADRLRFVSGYRFSDTASPGNLDAPLGAGQRPSTSSADAEVVATPAVLRMKLRNANPAAKVTGEDELAGTSNYFIGNDPAKWRTDVPTYAKVKYEGIYPGIDLIYYGNQRQLEYDFIVAPGADPRRITFDVRGAKRIRRDAHGDLVLKVGDGEIRWHKPVVYQEKDGARQEVAARYAITDANRVGFEVAKYDGSRPLYIDPLIYSTYLGGSGDDVGYGIAVDGAGNAYVIGYMYSTDFPSMNPLQAASSWVPDAFVSKLNPNGSALVYSTYLGGNAGDYGYGIAVDSTGNAYITGNTWSNDFPTTPGALETTCDALYGDAFVSKLNPTGSALLYSTCLGGRFYEAGLGISVDSTGNAYVAGITQSCNFPTTPGAFQTTCVPPNPYPIYEVFVSKLNPTGSTLVYSTYLSGSGGERGQAYGVAGIAVDSGGNAYVTGYTGAADFPVTPGAFQMKFGGNNDAFVSKLNPTGSALVYSTYLGGSSWDEGHGIAVDSAGNAYVTGRTTSPDFPTKNPFQPALADFENAFVAKINPTGSVLVYSTYLGGSGGQLGGEIGYGIAVDAAGHAYVTGYTCSTDFPTTTNAEQPANGGGYDAFVTKLALTGSALLYSTYLGGSGGEDDVQYGDGALAGIALNSAGNVYVTGNTRSTDFPTLKPLQAANGGGSDAFVTKIGVPAATLTTTTLSSGSPNPSTYGQAVTFTAVVNSSIGAPPDGETVTLMEATTILGTGTLSGGSATFTTSALPAGTDFVKAVYGGDSKFLGSKSQAVSQVVSKATSTTTLASSPNRSGFGQSVKFTATVSSPSGGTLTGSVAFKNGTATLATRKLSGGIATYATTALPLGSNTITAVYGGNSNYTGSTSAPVIQVVLPATTTTLSSSPNPSTYGQSVTFTAVVTSSLGGPPNGETVTFKKGTTVLGTGTLSGGSASLTISTLPAGNDYIKAVYGGDANFGPSTSKAFVQVVNKATTTTTLVSSLNPSNFGQSVTFTASVTPQFSGTVKATTVTFYDGTTALATKSLSGGVAKFMTSRLSQGTHSITATYNGSINFIGSSASLTQKVN